MFSIGRIHSAGRTSSKPKTLPYRKPNNGRDDAADGNQVANPGQAPERFDFLPADQQAKDGQHQPLPDIAEHRPKQDRERDRDQPGRVNLPIEGPRVGGYQHLEGAEYPRVPKRNRDIVVSAVAFRRECLDEGILGDLFQLLGKALQVDGRYPADNQVGVAEPAKADDRIGQQPAGADAPQQGLQLLLVFFPQPGKRFFQVGNFLAGFLDVAVKLGDDLLGRAVEIFRQGQRVQVCAASGPVENIGILGGARQPDDRVLRVLAQDEEHVWDALQAGLQPVDIRCGHEPQRPAQVAGGAQRTDIQVDVRDRLELAEKDLQLLQLFPRIDQLVAGLLYLMFDPVHDRAGRYRYPPRYRMLPWWVGLH